MSSSISIASICLAALGMIATSVALLHLYSIFFPDGCLARRIHPSDREVVHAINNAVERLDELTRRVRATNSSLAEIKTSLEDITRNQRLGEEPVDLVA